MSLATIRTALVEAVASVVGVGVVTDFEPYANREEDFTTYFVAEALGYVLGWTITREKTDEALTSLQESRAEHLMVIRGYRGVELGEHGATEKVLQDLIEAIRVRLREEVMGRLGGVAKRVTVPQVRLVEARSFGAHLVHYCEITLVCSEDFAIPEA